VRRPLPRCRVTAWRCRRGGRTPRIARIELCTAIACFPGCGGHSLTEGNEDDDVVASVVKLDSVGRAEQLVVRLEVLQPQVRPRARRQVPGGTTGQGCVEHEHERATGRLLRDSLVGPVNRE
jgi:hypothetical protein